MVDQIDRVYVINLAHRADRRGLWERQLDFIPSLKNHLQIITAVDGKDLENTSKLKNGELGCAMSHLSVWKDSLAKNYSTILVFEDDVILDNEFESRLTSLLAEIDNNYDWVYLYNTWDYRPVKPISDTLVKVIASLGTQAYLIKTEALSRLIPFVQEFEFPIDVIMGHMSFLSRVYRPKRVFVRHDESSESNVQENTKGKSKIMQLKNKFGFK